MARRPAPNKRQRALLQRFAAGEEPGARAPGHGGRESRSIRTRVIADQLGGISFPHARLAIHIHRRREPTGERETCESVYAVTSLDAHRTQTGRGGCSGATS